MGVGIRVGVYAFDRNKKYNNHLNLNQICRKYPIPKNTSECRMCSSFHIPPTFFVPKSITVVRDPFDRYVYIS